MADRMKNCPIKKAQEKPLLYYKTKEEIKAYKKKLVNISTNIKTIQDY